MLVREVRGWKGRGLVFVMRLGVVRLKVEAVPIPVLVLLLVQVKDWTVIHVFWECV